MQDKQKNEIVAIEEVNVKLENKPQATIDEALPVAKKLKEILDNKKDALVVRGKRYVEFGEWQLLGNFYKIGVEPEVAKPIVIHGDKGFVAKATAFHMPTGMKVAGAIAYCFKSESGKGNHDWNKIASMAQTRACSKALRNALGWVLELGGIPTTPADEIEDWADKEEKPKKKESYWEKRRKAAGIRNNEKKKEKTEDKTDKTDNNNEKNIESTKKEDNSTPPGIDPDTVQEAETTEKSESNGIDKTTKARIILQNVENELTEKGIAISNIEKLKILDRKKRMGEIGQIIFDECKLELGLTSKNNGIKA